MTKVKFAPEKAELQIGEFFFQLTTVQVERLRQDITPAPDVDVIEKWMRVAAGLTAFDELTAAVAAMRREQGKLEDEPELEAASIILRRAPVPDLDVIERWMRSAAGTQIAHVNSALRGEFSDDKDAQIMALADWVKGAQEIISKQKERIELGNEVCRIVEEDLPGARIEEHVGEELLDAVVAYREHR